MAQATTAYCRIGLGCSDGIGLPARPPDGGAVAPVFPVVLRTDGIGVLRLPRSLLRDQEMQEYHAYVIGLDGRIEKRINLFCSGDEAARERTRQIAAGRDVELWQGINLIETVKATH